MFDDDEFLEELRREFLAEGSSLLELWEESFLKLEDSENKAEEISTIFRVAHSFKGGSSAVGYSDLAAFAHIVEDLLSIIKKDPTTLNAEIVTLLLKCGDAFKQKINFLNGSDKTDWEITILSFDITNQLLMLGHAGHPEPQQVASAPAAHATELSEEEKAASIESDESWKKALADTNDKLGVNLTEEHLLMSEDDIAKEIAAQKEAMAQTEKALAEMQLIEPEVANVLKLTAKAIEPEKKVAPPTSSAPVANAKQSVSVKVDAHKIDKIMNLVGELVINKSQLANRVEQYREDHVLEATYSLLEKTIRELQDETLGMRMISMKNLFMKCQRAVRDVSLKLGKSIEFMQSGEDVEIDRSMVELLTDPLLHMLRNSADHGIAQDGVILLKAEHIGSKIVLTVKDNGRGIDAQKVFAKAKQNGLIPENAEIGSYSENEVFQFIMMPGFSTAEKITDVSGRGVGLDVVKTTIEKMNGKVEIESTVGKGTRFRLILPLTTSIQEGIHVKSADSSYIFPTEKVLEILAGDKVDFITDPNNLNMFKYRNMVIPYATLDSTLGVNPDFHVCKMILIMDVDGKYFGIGVDEFISQVHVVLKPINEIVKTSTGISASCILSHGGIGFVIDTDEVCKLVLRLNHVSNHKRVAA